MELEAGWTWLKRGFENNLTVTQRTHQTWGMPSRYFRRSRCRGGVGAEQGRGTVAVGGYSLAHFRWAGGEESVGEGARGFSRGGRGGAGGLGSGRGG